MMYGITALMEYNRKAAQDPRYAAIMRSRPAKKHRVYEIGNGIFFEYWNTHEWEFTVLNPNIDRKESYHLLNQLYADVCNIDPTYDKLHRIVKMARKTFANYLSEQ